MRCGSGLLSLLNEGYTHDQDYRGCGVHVARRMLGNWRERRPIRRRTKRSGGIRNYPS
jgi:hypothetical protein